MKNLLLPIAICAVSFLASCKQEYSGSISLLHQIQLRSTKGENVLINPESKSAKIKFTGKKKFELVMNTQLGERKFEFKTEQNLKKINSGDVLNLPANSNGQAYHLIAAYNVSTSSSGLQRSNESCTYTVSEHRCQDIRQPIACQQVRECDPSGISCKVREVCTDGQTVTKCGPVSVTRYGNQEVEYYHRTTLSRMDGQLLHPANNAQVATLNVSDSESEKIYQYRAVCR